MRLVVEAQDDLSELLNLLARDPKFEPVRVDRHSQGLASLDDASISESSRYTHARSECLPLEDGWITGRKILVKMFSAGATPKQGLPRSNGRNDVAREL